MSWWITLISRQMEKAGYSPFYAYKIFKKRFKDLFGKSDISLQKKIWAQKKGFFSNKLDYFNLTEKNYKDYLPDFEYSKLHPINGIFSRWIDDKLTIRMILHPYKEYLPNYYFHIVDGEILKLLDCPKLLSNSLRDIFQLLEIQQTLAIKAIAGSKGEGFYRISYRKNNYFLDDNNIQKNDLINKFHEWILNKDGGYIITEYLTPCQELSNIWSGTANSIRVSVIRNKFQNPKTISAYIRFGTIISGSVDNASSGGIGCRIVLTDGSFNGGRIINNKKLEACNYHPDSNVQLKGMIPNWKFITEKIEEISNFMPQVIYLGYDIVATDNGFKIIEINSHEGIAFHQSYLPYLADEHTKEFFFPLLIQKQNQLVSRKQQLWFNKIINFMKKIKHKVSQILGSRI